MGKEWEYDENNKCYSTTSYLQQSTLSDDILNECQLTNEQHRTLYKMNDTDNNTFNEISNWIEENL